MEEALNKIKEFDKKYKYLKWYIIFIILLPLLIYFYNSVFLPISETTKQDEFALMKIIETKMYMFYFSILLMPIFVISTLNVIKSLCIIINKIHPVIKLILVILSCGLIIYIFMDLIRSFIYNFKVNPVNYQFILGYILACLWLVINIIFVFTFIKNISLKWGNKDTKKSINKPTDLKVEQLESNQESEKNKKD